MRLKSVLPAQGKMLTANAFEAWGGVGGPPRIRELAARPRERQKPAGLPVERGPTPGGAPRLGKRPVVRRGLAPPRWTSGSRLEPERGRRPEMEEWRRGTRGGGCGTPDAGAAGERRQAALRGPHPAAVMAK
ncbi:hypothetical protein NDU88_003010 [Pleurodeles waltl]|uniref:Uncharacterized protein n=1 Tax=Pleurodeles waltl TaxID=8319 RepID=A0AAV7KUC9_PLEWA|nr:hypothetical protein NDU88_003010 [Pleurodeles waltl]